MLIVLCALLLVLVMASAEYLGDLSANPYNPNSTANPFGAGNPLSPTVNVQSAALQLTTVGSIE